MIRHLLLFSLLLTSITMHAQTIHPFCASDEMHSKMMNEDIRYKEQYEATQAYLKEHRISNYKTVTTSSGTEYHVPVVVHVIHTGGSVGSIYNPSDAAILSFINHINDGFANLNDDASIAGTYNSVNIPIRFYLAQRNELASCSATTGINRVNNSSNATYVASGVGSPGITDAALKSLVHWNDLDYYNIYIVNKIDGVDGNCAPCTYTAGYAQFPVLGGSETDGMVVLATQVSVTSTVFIHEMGHGFDLKHPFEGGGSGVCPSNTNCATDNDEVCDTDPIQLDFACNPTGNNPCTGTNWNLSTTQFNYMSYFGCTDRFTAGQAIRVNDAIGLVRTSYKNSAGLDAPPSALPVSITAPTFNSVNAGNLFGMGPIYVKLNAIEYTSESYTFEGAGSVFYVDHTCNQSTTLIKGQSYPITVKTKVNAQKVRVYIDWNNSGTFDAVSPELVFSSNGNPGNFTHSGTIVVPTSGVTYGTPLRMRVIADNNSGSFTATMQLNYGQAEDYTIQVLQAPLPVTWRDFSAQLIENNQASLRWSTEMELNNDYFNVEKSNDGISYTSIATIQGQTESTTPTHYAFLDKNVAIGTTYYRIKQTDIDGHSSYSEVKTVQSGRTGLNVTIYPNPVSDFITIETSIDQNARTQFDITDLGGKVVMHSSSLQQAGLNKTSLDISSLQNGLYLLKVVSNRESKVVRFVKQ